MGHDDLVIIGRVAGALAIGAMIGFERTFHGRPAGFRTHSLVCIASAILMIVTVYQNQWMTLLDHDAIRTDPTRMAQGIMTGIGFLGAGVIFKEGLTVRGLTTAASIWVTAAIGAVQREPGRIRRLRGRGRQRPGVRSGADLFRCDGRTVVGSNRRQRSRSGADRHADDLARAVQGRHPAGVSVASSRSDPGKRIGPRAVDL